MCLNCGYLVMCVVVVKLGSPLLVVSGGFFKIKTFRRFKERCTAVLFGAVFVSTKNDRDKALKQTPDNVRIREEAAARCTKVIKRRVLKKQARKARADHLVVCSLNGKVVARKYTDVNT